MKKIIILTVFLFNGCSTITNGTTQQIKINDGCNVVNNENVVQIKEGFITVKRSKKDLKIICNDVETIYKASLTKEALTSIAFIDFGLVDFLTNAAWGYDVD